MMEELAPQYRQARGFLQKLCIHDPQTGEHGGICVWESEESLRSFRQTELAKTMAQAYDIEGPTREQTVDVVYVLKPEETLPLAA